MYGPRVYPNWPAKSIRKTAQFPLAARSNLSSFYLSQIVTDAPRVGAHITFAYAGKRANIKAAAGAFSGDANHDVILESEPKGSCCSFNTALGGIGSPRSPSSCRVRRPATRRGLDRRSHIEMQRADIGIGFLLQLRGLGVIVSGVGRFGGGAQRQHGNKLRRSWQCQWLHRE